MTELTHPSSHDRRSCIQCIILCTVSRLSHYLSLEVSQPSKSRKSCAWILGIHFSSKIHLPDQLVVLLARYEAGSFAVREELRARGRERDEHDSDDDEDGSDGDSNHNR